MRPWLGLLLALTACRSGRMTDDPGAATKPAAPVPTTPDAACRASGYDFSIGVTDNHETSELHCGSGPGTPCEAGRAGRCEGSTRLYCLLGKLHTIDCDALCRQPDTARPLPGFGGSCVEHERNAHCKCHDPSGEPGDPAHDIRLPVPPPPAPRR